MQYQNRHEVESAIFHLASLLDELATGIDPDFDADYEDLDREFAECRLQLSNA
jgi:hypothetical protein